MIELTNVSLIGPSDSGIGFHIYVSREQMNFLIEHHAYNPPSEKLWISGKGNPKIHDDIPDPWLQKWGKLVKGDIILEIAKPMIEPRFGRKVQFIIIHAIRVTHRPTWEEMKAELMK